MTIRNAVYILKNRVNGKRYVGQTIRCLDYRLAEHAKTISETPVSRAIQKHGWHNFAVTTVEQGSIQELNELEEMLIAGLGSHVSAHGYNVRFGGDNHACCDDTKAKLRDRWTSDKRDDASERGHRQFADASVRRAHGDITRKAMANPEVIQMLKQKARESWQKDGNEERRAEQRQRQRSLKLGMRTQCALCGTKDGFDPIIDHRMCPSCRQLKDTADELGISSLNRFFNGQGISKKAGYFAGFDPNDE